MGRWSRLTAHGSETLITVGVEKSAGSSGGGQERHFLPASSAACLMPVPGLNTARLQLHSQQQRPSPLQAAGCRNFPATPLPACRRWLSTRGC